MDRETIIAFIKTHTHCVLATVTKDGNPEAAIIEYVANDKGEIIFDTSTDYRKYKNLLNNQHIAIAIGSGEENKGVQCEGIASLLQGEELIEAKKIYFAKRPEAKKWESDPTTIYFKVIPTWLRMRDYTTDPMMETEYLV